MTTDIKELAKQAVDELPEQDAAQVLDYIGYLRWRKEADQSWFWSEQWQARYQEAKADLEQGRFQEFDNIEDLLAELKGSSEL